MVEMSVGQAAVDHFDPGHFDNAMPLSGVQAGCFGI